MDDKYINGRRLSDLKKLEASKEFQALVAADPVIQGAFRDKSETRREQIGELLSVLGGDCVLGDKAVFPPPPAAVIAMLGILESPFLYRDKPLTIADVDAALYALIYQRDAFARIGDLDGEYKPACLGLCELLELDYERAAKGIAEVINQSFAAFRMIKGGQVKDDEKHYYDAYWLAGVIAAANEVANLSPQEVLWGIPMVTTGYLIVQGMRRSGDARIGRRTASFEAMARLEQLIDEWIPKMTRAA